MNWFISTTNLLVDDGSEAIKCCIWTETYQPPQIDYLGNSVILTGKKTQLFQDTILNITDISTSEFTLFASQFVFSHSILSLRRNSMAASFAEQIG